MEEVDNKQVIFKGYIERPPKETDMEIKVSKIKLRAPKASGAILVKNLYLSCDPFMRGRMRDFQGSYIPPFVPGQVVIIISSTTLTALNYITPFIHLLWNSVLFIVVILMLFLPLFEKFNFAHMHISFGSFIVQLN